MQWKSQKVVKLQGDTAAETVAHTSSRQAHNHRCKKTKEDKSKISIVLVLEHPPLTPQGQSWA